MYYEHNLFIISWALEASTWKEKPPLRERRKKEKKKEDTTWFDSETYFCARPHAAQPADDPRAGPRVRALDRRDLYARVGRAMESAPRAGVSCVAVILVPYCLFCYMNNMLYVSNRGEWCVGPWCEVGHLWTCWATRGNELKMIFLITY